jgi:hypothetical protein
MMSRQAIPGRLALAGRACTGKSALADALEALRPDTYRTAFADPIKAEFCAREGLTLLYLNAHKGRYRADLQHFGEAGRPDRWVDLLTGRVLRVQDQVGADGETPRFRLYVVDDVRYQNEVDRLRELGFTVVRLTAPEAVLRDRHERKYGRPMSRAEWDDPSESAVDALDVDEEWDAREDPSARIGRWLGSVARDLWRTLGAKN